MKTPLITVVRMSESFLDPEWKSYTKEEKCKWINSFYRAEKETNEQIAKYGSVEAWYESGEGRILNL